MSKAQKVYCDNCGTGLVSTFIKCPSCGGREFSEKPTSSPPIENPTITSGGKIGPAGKEELAGLGGWLILVGIGVVVGPIVLLARALYEFTSIFADGNWEAITTLGSEAYTPFLGPLIIFELIVIVGFFFALLYLAFLFFSKKMEFPKWYIRILAFSLFVAVADPLIVAALIPRLMIFDPGTIKDIFRAAIGAAIWIPYTLKSKRVKATFVN